MRTGASIYFLHLFKPLGLCKDSRLGEMCVDLGALTTERSRDFRISWWRFVWDFGM